MAVYHSSMSDNYFIETDEIFYAYNPKMSYENELQHSGNKDGYRSW